jgi:type I restriction-modification system DNA methylase subunit
MASLFGKNKLRDLASKLDTSSLKAKIAIVKRWHDDYYNRSLKADKETSREQAYNQDFFIKVLGYKEKPAAPYSFEPKATTEKGQLPDAVIGYTDTSKDITNIAAVVELKGASIELDRPQRREGNMSPVQQGFKYKTQYRNCPFVIVSNFWEFRLYHDNLLDYELWTLDDLVNPADDYLLFKTWYVLLHHDNFIADKGASKTEHLLSDIRIEQEEIGKKFYKVYKAARLDLLRDIYKRNPQIRTDIDMGIEKAQKIIDRIVFACFAEDRGLLPDNTLQRVLEAADSSTYGGSLWNTFKGFFEAIDVGSPKLDIPKGYNGGLFKRDEILNNLQIGDEALRAVASLSIYNFAEDLSVAILGHIFEQSISDLEEIKNKVKESQNLEILAQSRRKKDGIFYTPDYIVRYIVENSLGAYLREHEEKFKEEFGLKGDIADKTYDKREKQAYAKYQDFLQNVKVLDPACGSGAFLVYVFDYLLAENKRVNDILGSTLFTNDQYIKSILQNNIYGVDLNEESVEITKLSLWLKSAQKGKKLTALDDNIKCGNSLIDDPTVAGDKAFDWKQEFSEIMQRGGFDVVVGNPPYGAKVSKSELQHLLSQLNYQAITPTLSDTYIVFYMHCLQSVLKDGGLLGFIAPNTWRLIAAADKFRNVLLTSDSYKTISITQHKEKVFADATVDCDTVIIKKAQTSKDHKIHLRITKKDIVEFDQRISANTLADHHYINLRLTPSDYALKKKIVDMSHPLGEICEVKNGVKPYEVGKGSPPQTRDTVNNKPFTADTQLDVSFSPLIGGSSFHRYKLIWDNDYWIKYGPWLAAPRDKSIFDVPKKIIFRQTSDRIIGTIIGGGFIMRDNTHIVLPKPSHQVDLNYILGLSNSKLVDYFYQTINPERGEALAQVKLFHVAQLPVRLEGEQRLTIANYAKQLLDNSDSLQKQNRRFVKLIQNEFILKKWSTKLSKWWRLDFVNFLSALKVQLSLQQKDELLSLFEKYKTECLELDTKIQETDHEIDQLVYKLYELTPEEIAIVETSR